MLCHSRLYIHLVCGLLIGVLFLNIGGDAAHVFNNFSLLFFCLMFLMFTALSAMILACEYSLPSAVPTEPRTPRREGRPANARRASVCCPSPRRDIH